MDHAVDRTTSTHFVSAHRMTTCAEVMRPAPRGSRSTVAVSISGRCNPSIAPLSHVASVGDGTFLNRWNPFVSSIAAASSVRGCATPDRCHPFMAAGTLVTSVGDVTWTDRSIAAAPSVRGCSTSDQLQSVHCCGYARPLRRRRHVFRTIEPVRSIDYARLR